MELGDVRFQEEKFSAAWWAEAGPMATEHFKEVEEGVEARRPLRLNTRLFRDLNECGAIKIWTARAGARLVGYITWTITPDIESEGLTIGKQGAWFVSPAVSSLHIGARLFTYSIEQMKRLDVDCVFPHHRMQGRGSALGVFFERLGAKKIQDEYLLWIKD